MRDGDPEARVLGYPLATVPAEKITTAIDLGATNSRVRDYADIWTLTRIHDIDAAELRAALVATAAHRGIQLRPLVKAVADLGTVRQATYSAYRRRNVGDDYELPETLDQIIAAVVEFADPVITGDVDTASSWRAIDSAWHR